MNKIAIFGSTGHIGKNLISFLANDKNCDLILFSRNSKKNEMLDNLFPESSLVIEEYDKFESDEYDVIINCIGITNPVDITKYYSKILEVGEFYDNKIINFLKKSPSTLYINMSSGAVYDTKFDSPVDDKTPTILDINHNNSVHYYALSKINSEISDPYLGKAVKLLESQQYELTFNKDFASFKKMERMNTETSRIVEAYANSFSNFTGEYYYNYHEKIGVHKEEFSGESFLIQNLWWLIPLSIVLFL